MKFKEKMRYKTLKLKEFLNLLPDYKQEHNCTNKNCRDCIRHDGHYYCKAYNRFMDPQAIPCKYAVENKLLIKKRKYKLIIKKGSTKK